MADSKKYNPRVPSEYQEIEYIQSGSYYLQTGYIDTGLVGTDLYGCEIESCMKVIINTDSNLYYLNGAYEAGHVTQTGLIREDTKYVHSIVNMGFDTALYSGSIALNDWHTIYTSDGIQKTDGVIISNETYGTFNNLRYLLFARSDTGVTLSPPFAMKYFWVKKNGQYIRNMIPAKRKSDNVVGMYDIANDVFYTSENQYAFIGGSNVNNWLHSLRKLTTATDTLATLPAVVYADGNNATVGLKGNMVQTSTPTPSAPISVTGVGNKTANLSTIYSPNISSSGGMNFEGVGDKLRLYGDTDTYVQCINTNNISLAEGTYTISISSTRNNSACYAQFRSEDGTSTYATISMNSATTVTFNAAVSGRIRVICQGTASTHYNTDEIVSIMINEGSTSQSYEPSGYKIPISSANTTTNVYLGEVETTRLVKKLVLTGDNSETYTYDSQYSRFIMVVSDAYSVGTRKTQCYCSHYNCVYHEESIDDVPDNSIYINYQKAGTQFCIKTTSYTTIEDFKSYLQQQYAAGTPVTIWYVLATPTTGIVNEPLRKIGDYADTVSGITIPTITGKDSFDVLTTLKPSEVSLSYTGWHDASVGEWNGSEWQ